MAAWLGIHLDWALFLTLLGSLHVPGRDWLQNLGPGQAVLAKWIALIASCIAMKSLGKLIHKRLQQLVHKYL